MPAIWQAADLIPASAAAGDAGNSLGAGPRSASPPSTGHRRAASEPAGRRTLESKGYLMNAIQEIVVRGRT